MFRTRLVALCATAVLALSACGGNDTAASADQAPASTKSIDTILAAAEQANQAETARFTMDVLSNGQSISKASGEMNLMTGDGTMNIEIQGMTTEMVIKDAQYFMRVPAEAAAGLGGKEWMSMTLEDLSAAGAGTTDPNSSKQSLDMLTGLNDDVQEVGKETINGVSVTHYRGTVNFSDAAKPEAWTTEQMTAMQEMFGQNTPADVYLDDEGQLRRMSYEMNMPGVGNVTFVMDFSDFGIEVNPTVPDPASVISYQELVAAAGQ